MVLYFADGWMVKVKSDRYKLVKAMRPSYATRAAAWSFLQQVPATLADLGSPYHRLRTRTPHRPAYERQAFGERDIDMTKVNDIVDHVR